MPQIHEGKVDASIVNRRLGKCRIRNPLYYDFRELGTAIPTHFLLEYISAVKMRETIQAATR